MVAKVSEKGFYGVVLVQWLGCWKRLEKSERFVATVVACRATDSSDIRVCEKPGVVSDRTRGRPVQLTHLDERMFPSRCH